MAENAALDDGWICLGMQNVACLAVCKRVRAKLVIRAQTSAAAAACSRMLMAIDTDGQILALPC